MANKTLTDRGVGTAMVAFERRDNGTIEARVRIMTDIDERIVVLTQAELVAATTGAERTATLSVLAKLYAAALAKDGFA